MSNECEHIIGYYSHYDDSNLININDNVRFKEKEWCSFEDDYDNCVLFDDIEDGWPSSWGEKPESCSKCDLNKFSYIKFFKYCPLCGKENCLEL